MSDLKNLDQRENNNRERIFKIINQVPVGIPTGWEREYISVGGLMYVGFSERHPHQLICISSQHESLIDCTTGEKRYAEICYDENNLTAYADGPELELIHLAGEGGGGFRHYSKDGNILDRVSLFWPREQIIFMPNWNSFWSSPADCWIVSDECGILAYGFNKDGDIFIIATSSDLIIYRKLTKS